MINFVFNLKINHMFYSVPGYMCCHVIVLKIEFVNSGLNILLSEIYVKIKKILLKKNA